MDYNLAVLAPPLCILAGEGHRRSNGPASCEASVGHGCDEVLPAGLAAAAVFDCARRGEHFGEEVQT